MQQHSPGGLEIFSQTPDIRISDLFAENMPRNDKSLYF